MTTNIRQLILWLVFILYLFVVLKLTFFKGVIGTIKYDKMPTFPLKVRLQTVQLVPFRTITDYVVQDETFQHRFKTLSSFQKIEFVIQNLLGNIILFVPLGVLLPLVFNSLKSVGRILSISFLGSLVIEVCQLIFNRGFFDVDDIILNTLGGYLGYAVFKLGKRYQLI